MFDNLHLFLKSNKEFDVAYINIKGFLAKITDISVKTYYTKAHSL